MPPDLPPFSKTEVSLLAPGLVATFCLDSLPPFAWTLLAPFAWTCWHLLPGLVGTFCLDLLAAFAWACWQLLANVLPPLGTCCSWLALDAEQKSKF